MTDPTPLKPGRHPPPPNLQKLPKLNPLPLPTHPPILTRSTDSSRLASAGKGLDDAAWGRFG